MMVKSAGLDAAAQALHHAAPVGEKDAYVGRLLSAIRPFIAHPTQCATLFCTYLAAMVSLSYILEDGASAELAVFGSEGKPPPARGMPSDSKSWFASAQTGRAGAAKNNVRSR